MNLPNDSFLLLSAVNTKLRDYYSNLDILCDDLGENRTELEEKPADIGYYYGEQLNQFVAR
ncbi:MAG: DUF4250 domain-containing protein [Clostridia bacterium]|nr:DUF4250 domain-containing protein [Clostridia bacterium]